MQLNGENTKIKIHTQLSTHKIVYNNNNKKNNNTQEKNKIEIKKKRNPTQWKINCKTINCANTMSESTVLFFCLCMQCGIGLTINRLVWCWARVHTQSLFLTHAHNSTSQPDTHTKPKNSQHQRSVERGEINYFAQKKTKHEEEEEKESNLWFGFAFFCK